MPSHVVLQLISNSLHIILYLENHYILCLLIIYILFHHSKSSATEHDGLPSRIELPPAFSFSVCTHQILASCRSPSFRKSPAIGNRLLWALIIAISVWRSPAPSRWSSLNHLGGIFRHGESLAVGCIPARFKLRRIVNHACQRID